MSEPSSRAPGSRILTAACVFALATGVVLFAVIADAVATTTTVTTTTISTSTVPPSTTTTTTTTLPPGPCGDGVLNAGEDCDDGNTQAGDCCSSTCAHEPLGMSCGTGEGLCGQAFPYICDGQGACVETFTTACAYTTRRFRGNLRDNDAPNGDRIVIRSRDFEYDQTADALGDPSNDTKYALCIFTADLFSANYELVYQLDLPTGAGWEPILNGWRFRAPDDASALRDLSFQAEDTHEPFGPDLRVELHLNARGAGLALPGPVSALRYFDGDEVSMCLVNDLGLTTGSSSFGQFLLNTLKRVRLGPIRGD